MSTCGRLLNDVQSYEVYCLPNLKSNVRLQIDTLLY
uniref:Uncharacterized protein n=1 Tax=Arundo donax TaxID=35708 RepID=A0A0A9AUV8_ARUDO